MKNAAYKEWLESAVETMFRRHSAEYIRDKVLMWNARTGKMRSAGGLRSLVTGFLRGTHFAYDSRKSGHPYCKTVDVEQIARWLLKRLELEPAPDDSNTQTAETATVELHPLVPGFMAATGKLTMPKLAEGKLDKPTEVPWPYKVGEFDEHYSVLIETKYGVIAESTRSPNLQFTIRFGEPVGKQLCEIYEQHSLLTFADGDLLDDKRHLLHPRDFDYNKEGITMSDVSRLENLMLDKVRQWDLSGLPQPLAKKEITMSTSDKEITVTTQVLINGVPAKGFTDAQIYDLIAQQEGKIAELDAIKNKPKRLKEEIAKRQAGIDALVKHLDGEAADKA